MTGVTADSLSSLRESIGEMERWMERADEGWLEERLEPIVSC